MRAIDGDALRRKIQQIAFHGNGGILTVQAINEAPTLDVKPVRRGHWIITGRANVYGGTEIECSECRERVMILHIEDELYCRHCGAKMWEDEEE